MLPLIVTVAGIAAWLAVANVAHAALVATIHRGADVMRTKGCSAATIERYVSLQTADLWLPCLAFPLTFAALFIIFLNARAELQS